MTLNIQIDQLPPVGNTPVLVHHIENIAQQCKFTINSLKNANLHRTCSNPLLHAEICPGGFREAQRKISGKKRPCRCIDGGNNSINKIDEA